MENFCKPFDRDDPDKVDTGIAFLIVCDMLLTGFDAPVEQVMYIDKKIREHNLLQAIARVNRVASGKKRGYVVDYIGLANHLTAALTLYAAADEEDELREGLKSILSEMPVLEERFNRLIQHFEAMGIAQIRDFVAGAMADPAAEVSLMHQAVGRLKDIERRADFEVFLKKFLMSLDIVLPNPAADAYRVPARRFGYLLRMTKERYKDETLDLGDAGEKVKRLINEHLVSLGINPKVPPVELLAEDFLEQLNRHAGGNKEAKASEMEHAIRKHCTVHFNEDPAFYGRLSEKLEQLLKRHRENWDVLTEHLEKLRSQAVAGRQTVVLGLDHEETTFFDHVAMLAFGAAEVPADRIEAMMALIRGVVALLQETIGLIDFWNNPAEQRKLRGTLTDTLLLADIPEVTDNHERLAVEILKLAKHRHDRILEPRQPMKAKKTDNIQYRLLRSASRRTADIILERDGTLTVRAPADMPDYAVDDIVRDKRYWIYKNMAEWRELNVSRVMREFRNGEGFLYLGRSYRLSIVNDQPAPLVLKNGRFLLQRRVAELGESVARATFQLFYTDKGREKLPRRVEAYAGKVGAAVNRVCVGELGYRWASCNIQGKLLFNWKCLMAPLKIIDYIVVHELCHLYHRDHDRAFWNEMDKVMPDYPERKEWLRKHGASMDI